MNKMDKQEVGTVEKQKRKLSIPKSVKRAAVLGVMFTMGVSVFAQGHGKGTLFKEYNHDMYNMEAVDDMCKILCYTDFSIKDDGKIDSIEREMLEKMKAQYDKDYGEGACKAVITEMAEYSQTPGGIGILAQERRGEISSEVAWKGIVSMGVDRARNVQNSVIHLGGTLKDAYEDRGR